jgi:hypothetical protein
MSSLEYDTRSLAKLKAETDKIQNSGRKRHLAVRFSGGFNAIEDGPYGHSLIDFYWFPKDRTWHWKQNSMDKAVRSTRPDTWVRAAMRTNPGMMVEYVIVDRRLVYPKDEDYVSSMGRMKENKAARVIQAAVRARHAKRNAAARTIQRAYEHHLYKPGGRAMLRAWQKFNMAK